MNETDRMSRNRSRLEELYPSFAARVQMVIETLQAAHLRPRIQDAYRSPQDQLIAFQGGFSKLKFGFHNVTGPDGRKESLAVDMLDDDHPLASSKPYLLQLAAAAESAGLATGIRWGVSAGLVAAIDAAIAAHNWSADVKIGWDPTHVEPKGITVAQAKAGARPK